VDPLHSDDTTPHAGGEPAESDWSTIRVWSLAIGRWGGPPFGAAAIGYYTVLVASIGALVWIVSGVEIPWIRLQSTVLSIVCLVLVLTVLGAWWLAATIKSFSARSRRRPGLLIAPALLVATFALVINNVPADLRWQLSRPALDEFAAQYTDNPQIEAPGRLGLYLIERGPEPVAGGFLIWLDSNRDGARRSPLDDGLAYGESGFAYLLAGPTPYEGSPSTSHLHYTHIAGPWFWWEYT
jgi:hypothetical protein